VYSPQQEHIDTEVEGTLFDRRVTATMSRALRPTGTDCERGARHSTPNEISDSVGEGASYELCQALSKAVNALDITFNWSRVSALPPAPAPI
jgi:hypothetical protein